MASKKKEIKQKLLFSQDRLNVFLHEEFLPDVRDVELIPVGILGRDAGSIQPGPGGSSQTHTGQRWTALGRSFPLAACCRWLTFGFAEQL